MYDRLSGLPLDKVFNLFLVLEMSVVLIGMTLMGLTALAQHVLVCDLRAR
ncbi:hypothetical protein SynSYN20_01816 [Synechococcus sp. SYN20]|nr:hypothetical protein SynSYN20_01816 [Synechococcus sp. SYN20]